MGPNYRDIFPTPPPPGMVPNCAEGGVLGVLPGIIGSIQASEVIKVLTGIGAPLSGKLFLFDVLDFSTRVLNIKRDPLNPLNGIIPSITELIDYEEFCGLKQLTTIEVLAPQDLHRRILEGEALCLIDVREEEEFHQANIGGKWIPLNEIERRFDEIPKSGTVVLICKSGQRSATAIRRLIDQQGYQNLCNLEGGLIAWKRVISPDLNLF